MTNNFTLAVTGQSLIKHDIGQIQDPGFRDLQTVLRGADLAFTNFESTIFGRHRGWPLKGSFFGSSEPAVLDALQAIGFGALSLSNNHAFDLGPSGVLSTLEEVEKRGFLHAGLGRNRAQASVAGIGAIGTRKVAIVAMDGGPGPDFMYATDASRDRPERPGVNRLRLSQVLEVDEIAFQHLRAVRDKIGYTVMDLANDSQPDDPHSIDESTEVGIARATFRRSDRFHRNIKIDEDDLSRNLTAIAAAAAEGSLVIAYLHHHHWASDWYKVPDWVGTIAKKCIDAGASIFLSHGAPVLQPIEIYRERPIFYSLGNFIFHVRSGNSPWAAREVWESVVGSCSFDEDNNLVKMTFYPIVIGGDGAFENGNLERRLVPELVTGVSAQRILQRFQKQSEKLSTHIEISDGVGILNL